MLGLDRDKQWKRHPCPLLVGVDPVAHLGGYGLWKAALVTSNDNGNVAALDTWCLFFYLWPAKNDMKVKPFYFQAKRLKGRLRADADAVLLEVFVPHALDLWNLGRMLRHTQRYETVESVACYWFIILRIIAARRLPFRLMWPEPPYKPKPPPPPHRPSPDRRETIRVRCACARIGTGLGALDSSWLFN